MLYYLWGFCKLSFPEWFLIFSSCIFFFVFTRSSNSMHRFGVATQQIFTWKVVWKIFTNIFFLSGYPFFQRALLEILLKCVSGVKCIRHRQGWASVQNGLSSQEVNDKEHYATLKKKSICAKDYKSSWTAWKRSVYLENFYI